MTITSFQLVAITDMSPNSRTFCAAADFAAMGALLTTKADLTSETQSVQMLELRLWDAANSNYRKILSGDGSISFLNSDGSPIDETNGLTDLARVAAVNTALGFEGNNPLSAGAGLMAKLVIRVAASGRICG